MQKRRIVYIIRTIAILIAGGTFTVLACLYFQCEIYDFSKPEPFSGDQLYNPYENITGNWVKANFHAHSIAWGGLTNGAVPDNVLIITYAGLGYDIACISNYQSVDQLDYSPTSIPVYEHGFNIFKTHQLCFSPQHISFFDLPLFQNTSIKQSVINSLDSKSNCIALAHPEINNGYTDNDLQLLSGYQIMEVLNHSANSSSKWDITLSNGKAVWILGDDDSHNATDPSQTGVDWTMIAGKSKADTKETFEAVKKGNAYAVSGKGAKNDNELSYVKTDGSEMFLKLKYPAAEIELIGQGGALKNFY